MIHILTVTRLYSGLIHSVESGEWEPRGAPAIARLFEGFDQDIEIRHTAFLVSQSTQSDSSQNSIQHLEIKGLKAEIKLIPFGRSKRSVFWFNVINELRLFLKLLRHTKNIEYDLLYVDRGNVMFGAFVARFTTKTVVLRLLGVGTESLQRVMGPSAELRYRDRIKKFLFGSRFEGVIATQDGSGVEKFRSSVIHRATTTKLWLNGCSRQSLQTKKSPVGQHGDSTATSNCVTFLWLGRMVEGKGLTQFIDSLIILSQMTKAFNVFLVGDGPLRNKAQKMIEGTIAEERVHFEGSVSLDESVEHIEKADVVVSLNSLGDISNVVLEAISRSKIVVGLDPQRRSIEVFPEPWYVAVTDSTNSQALSEVLMGLVTDRIGTSEIVKNVSEASRLIPSWPERIQREIEFLKTLNQN